MLGKHLQRQAPAKRLDVDHRVQAPGQRDTQGQRQHQGQQRQQPGLPEVEQHQLPAGHAQRPQRRQLPETALALRQQADEQRHAGHAKGQAIERGGGGEGALEHLRRPALEPGLVDDAAVFQGEACLQRRHERRYQCRLDAQVEAVRCQLRPGAQQVIDVDQQVALGIAIVGVDADDARRPWTVGRGNRQLIAERHLQAPRQLFAQHHRVVRCQAIPGLVVQGFQQRPVLTIGRVIDHAKDIRRPALQLNGNLPVGQHRRQLRLLLEPVVHLPSLGRVLWIEVELGSQPLFQPVAEGLAKTGGHAAGTDVGRQGQQQRHQRQAQGRQLLPAIGDEPLAEHRSTAVGQAIEHGIEHHRQRQRGAQQ
ncbi:hypothetical protein D3C76_772800 [compost metagenome]